MLLAYMSTGSTMLHCTCSPCLGWVGSCLFAKCWTGSLIRWIGSGWVQHPCPPLREPARDGAGRGRPGAEQHRDGYLPIADDVRRSNRGPFILASDVTRVLGARGRSSEVRPSLGVPERPQLGNIRAPTPMKGAQGSKVKCYTEK